MIHARIDTVDHRQIVGFETGTRALFDARRGGDPLWVFLDSYRVKYRADFHDFLINPFHYKILLTGDIQITTDSPIIIDDEEPDIMPGYVALVGADGDYLQGADGKFILAYDVGYNPPPSGNVYLLDDNNTFITDPDGDFLMEPTNDADSLVYLTDEDGSQLTDIDDSLLTDS